MDDLISRRSALAAIEDLEKHTFNGVYEGVHRAYKIIANLPTAQPRKGMTKIDTLIADVAYLLDSLRALREIENSGSCMDCGNLKNCEYMPRTGELTRFNCPLHVEKNSNEG